MDYKLAIFAGWNHINGTPPNLPYLKLGINKYGKLVNHGATFGIWIACGYSIPNMTRGVYG